MEKKGPLVFSTKRELYFQFIKNIYIKNSNNNSRRMLIFSNTINKQATLVSNMGNNNLSCQSAL